MTKSDFLKKLQEQGEVDFGGSIVATNSDHVETALVHSLSEVLSPEETVISGVQTSSLGSGLTGKLGWLLVLRNHVLELSAEIKDEAQGRPTLRVGHEFHRKAHLSATVEVQYSEVVLNRLSLVPRGATVSLRIGSRPITIQSGQDLKPEGLLRFAGSVLAERS